MLGLKLSRFYNKKGYKGYTGIVFQAPKGWGRIVKSHWSFNVVTRPQHEGTWKTTVATTSFVFYRMSGQTDFF